MGSKRKNSKSFKMTPEIWKMIRLWGTLLFVFVIIAKPMANLTSAEFFPLAIVSFVIMIVGWAEKLVTMMLKGNDDDDY